VSGEALQRLDAPVAVDRPCHHEKWNVLNAVMGCIHPDHGRYPFDLVDHHTGIHLVDGIPTRYLPDPKAAPA
jgi:hypothetical protein